MRAITKQEALELFQKIDAELLKTGQRAQVTVLGGLAIILQDFRERSTLDFDIAPSPDAKIFSKICDKLTIPLDIVTMSSTVDLAHADTTVQFSGQFLTVHSVMAEDLIKLKLERFQKQDPEDIMAIIDKTNLSYDVFKKIVREMLLDFVGHPRGLILSAQEVVERKYNQHLDDFLKSVK